MPGSCSVCSSSVRAQELLLAVNDKRRKMEMLVEALRGETPLARTLVFVQIGEAVPRAANLERADWLQHFGLTPNRFAIHLKR